MRFQHILKRMCEESRHKRFKMAALLIQGGSIVNYGVNRVGNSVVTNKSKHVRPFVRSIHAEVDAILGVSKDKARRCYMMVGRINKNGKFCNARPCALCQDILVRMGVRRVYYSTGEYKDGEPVFDVISLAAVSSI